MHNEGLLEIPVLLHYFHGNFCFTTLVCSVQPTRQGIKEQKLRDATTIQTRHLMNIFLIRKVITVSFDAVYKL